MLASPARPAIGWNVWASNFPRPTPGAVEPCVGFIVADESFLRRVPFQFAVIPISEVPKMTNRHGAATDFDVANRQLAAANAIKPVLQMIAAGIKPDGLVPQLFLSQCFRLRRESAAVHKDFPFGSDERHTA